MRTEIIAKIYVTVLINRVADVLKNLDMISSGAYCGNSVSAMASFEGFAESYDGWTESDLQQELDSLLKVV